jgi:hypothetical protein
MILEDTGANASAEEQEEGVEDGAQQVNNVVNSFRLQSTSFDKKSYLTHLKCMPPHSVMILFFDKRSIHEGCQREDEDIWQR